ncbi:RidA family protein [Kribbella sp. NBC_01245]|uniref:RidA family protein n=1 Tax=Kribbella sp. NBC_01245 TaxID=2903578 RepID=UPI002E2D0FCB|nr:RidA family protein [Kribbella sp. NBC_01245]
MSGHFNPPRMWAPNGRAFSQGVVQPPGQVIHVTGQVAWDEDSNVVGISDAGMQLEKSLDNVRIILAEVGGTLADIVSMTIYFLDRGDLPAIQEVRARHFPAATAPASILIQAAGLVAPELLVEVVPIAVVPLSRFREPQAGGRLS